MQKVIQVVSHRTERNPILLSKKIEKGVADFVASEKGAKLNEFVINTANLDAEGYGQALVTINYDIGSKNPMPSRK